MKKTAMTKMYDLIAEIKKEIEVRKFTASKAEMILIEASLIPIDELVKKHEFFILQEYNQIVDSYTAALSDSELTENTIHGANYYKQNFTT